MLKAAIVDFDDTLCPTEEACFNLENEALMRMGREPMPREVHKHTWGQPLFEAIKERSPGVNVRQFKKIVLEAHAEWIASGKIDVVPPENLLMLDDLMHKYYIQVFVLTSRTHDEAKHLMEPDHILAARIKAFYHKDITVFHKPDPRVFKKLLGDHRLKPIECVYVGDAPSDARAAKGAGLHFVASLEAGIRTRKDFSGEQVDYFIQKFTSLSRALAALERRAEKDIVRA